jgi:hypothetical protein
MAYKVVNGKLVAIRNKPKKLQLPKPHTVQPAKAIDFMALESASKKGEYLGLCNRQACLRPGANWYNKITQAHYCSSCAMLINDVCRDNRTELFCSKVQNKEISNEIV